MKESVIICGREFSLRYSAPQFSLSLPWSMSCRVDGEGGPLVAQWFKDREGALLDVAFVIPAIGIVFGRAFCDARPLLVNGDVSLQFSASSPLEQLRDWPDPLPPDTQVAHKTTILKLETEVAAQALGLCPPGVNVEIRRTERARGIEPGKLVIQMWVGVKSW